MEVRSTIILEFLIVFQVDLNYFHISKVSRITKVHVFIMAPFWSNCKTSIFRLKFIDVRRNSLADSWLHGVSGLSARSRNNIVPIPIAGSPYAGCAIPKWLLQLGFSQFRWLLWRLVSRDKTVGRKPCIWSRSLWNDCSRRNHGLSSRKESALIRSHNAWQYFPLCNHHRHGVSELLSNYSRKLKIPLAFKTPLYYSLIFSPFNSCSPKI